MTIKWVEQKHKNGCVVACLSMVTGIPYDDIMHDFTGDRTDEGLSCFVYDVWLAYKGYAIQRVYKHYSPLHADRQSWPPSPFADTHLALADTAQGSHCLVWQRNGAVLDPLIETHRTLSDYTVGMITGVYQVGEPIETGPLSYLHWSGRDKKCLWCGADSDTYKHRDPCPARNNG